MKCGPMTSTGSVGDPRKNFLGIFEFDNETMLSNRVEIVESF